MLQLFMFVSTDYSKNMKKLNAIDIFSGAGGLSLGMSNAGVNVFLANELNYDFAKTHEINHRDCFIINDDISNVDFNSVISDLGYKNKVDIVCGGPPCQGFSTIGSKKFADPRNSLFGQFLRVVDEASPKYVLFENVAGFKRLYNGEVYKILIEELRKRNFSTISNILNAKDFGLPQSRYRTIVIGWKSNLRPVVFPEATHSDSFDLFSNKKKPTLNLIDAISDLPPLKVGEHSEFYLTNPKNEYQRILRGECISLTEHNCANYGEKMQEILSLIPDGGSIEDIPERLRPKSYFKNTYSRLLPNKPSPTITRNFGTPSSSRCVHPFQNRALSTREGARLQGFPDDYVFFGAKGSKNLQIGNAVPPIFGEVLARSIINSSE